MVSPGFGLAVLAVAGGDLDCVQVQRGESGILEDGDEKPCPCRSAQENFSMWIVNLANFL